MRSIGTPMAEFTFIADAGEKIKEIEPTGSHTAAQSREKGETDTRILNPAAAARLEQILREYEFSVSDLNLEVEKETVIISGKVKDQETREKVILTVGNIQGISKVKEELAIGNEAPEAIFHTVQREDSLESIAEKVHGDPAKSKEILSANTPMLKSGNEIYPGMVLRIPAKQ